MNAMATAIITEFWGTCFTGLSWKRDHFEKMILTAATRIEKDGAATSAVVAAPFGVRSVQPLSVRPD